MTSKQLNFEMERQFFSQYACLSSETKGRQREETPCDLRTDFQRDRDRIIHCSSFRRLKHKTQVFIAPEGDHYRTRLTHTLEVSQIARTIARALRLNEDLTEAIALGHDLGHTPFGHAGERALNECTNDGFRHYEQSLRVVDFLEKRGRGLNLTFEVRNGILCHTRGEEAATLEGRIVRFADKIAYMNHDIDDAIKGRIMSEDELPTFIKKGLGTTKTQRISTLTHALIKGSYECDTIKFTPEVDELFNSFHSFMFDSLYTNPIAKGEEKKAEQMIKTLYHYFYNHPEKLPDEYSEIYKSQGAERAAVDYVAGMTDRFAIYTYKELFLPKSWGVLN